MTSDVASEQVTVFKERLLFQLESWHREAREVDINTLDYVMHRDDGPTTKAWQYSLSKLNSEKVVKILIDHTPEASQGILGGELSPENLERLPRDWEHNTLHGVYVDLTMHKDGSDYHPYGGLATRTQGLHGRISLYQCIRRNGLPPAKARNPSKYEARLGDPDIDCKIRVVGIFASDSWELWAYKNLYELCISSLLECFNNTKVGRFATRAARELVAKGRHPDLPVTDHNGLNDAVQLLPMMHGHQKQIKKCVNCEVTHPGDWYSLEPGVLLGRRLCTACHQYREKHGMMRPKAQIEWANLRYGKGDPMPADSRRTSCTNIVEGDQQSAWCRHLISLHGCAVSVMVKKGR